MKYKFDSVKGTVNGRPIGQSMLDGAPKEINISTDWAAAIHSSHRYFWDKTGLSPNKLLLHPSVRVELALNKALEYLCDRAVTQFMGCQVIETVDVKDFNWAYVVNE